MPLWGTVGLSRFALCEPLMPNNINQGIDYHKVNGPIDFSQVFLSSSMDWSVKMWVNGKSVRSSFVGLCALISIAEQEQPGHSFIRGRKRMHL